MRSLKNTLRSGKGSNVAMWILDNWFVKGRCRNCTVVGFFFKFICMLFFWLFIVHYCKMTYKSTVQLSFHRCHCLHMQYLTVQLIMWEGVITIIKQEMVEMVPPPVYFYVIHSKQLNYSVVYHGCFVFVCFFKYYFNNGKSLAGEKNQYCTSLPHSL